MAKKRSNEVDQIIKKFKTEMNPAKLNEMREAFNKGVDMYMKKESA